MGQTANATKTQKTSFTKRVSAEFKKIIWPDKTTLVRQTIAVVVSSLVLGGIIALVDSIIRVGIDLLVNL